MNLYDQKFLVFADATSPAQDNEKAKEYAITHWDLMSPEGRKLYDWKYGRESRLPNYLTTNYENAALAHHYEGRILARQEREGMFD